jgi:WhiB family redox-sensing transcriptional regulator
MTNPRVIEVLGWHSEIPGWDLPDPGEASWQDSALCAQTDPELFFPEKGGSVTAAKKVCATCPVTAACLEFALEHRMSHGIFGGMTERRRRPMLAAREAGAA